MTNIEKNLKFLIYTGLAILLYVPFIVSNSLFFPYITGKAFTFRIVVEILVAIWLILAILYPKYRPKKNWILISFILFTLSLFFSNLFGVNPEASFWSNLERMEGWVTIVHLLGLFIVMGSVLRTKKEWYALFNVSLVSSLAMVLVAVNEVIEVSRATGINPWSHRVDATIGNSTYVAIYALFNAFLSLLLLFKDTERLRDFFTRFKDTFSKNWPILFYIITFILNIWVLFQTGTRGAMLGFIGGLVLIGLLMAFLEKDKVIYKKIAIGLISAAVLFVGTIFAFKDTSFVQNNQPLNRLTSIIQNTEDGTIKLEGTSQARINNWIHATRGFKERPILGWGQSNFNYVYDKYYLPRHHGNETWFDRAHNIIFDWLIAGGIFGLLFYLSIWATTVLSIFKTAKLENREKAILVSMLAGYFVHLLFVFDALVSYLYFVFILAFVYAINIDEKEDKKESRQYQFSESFRQILVWLIIVVTPFVVYLVNYQPYKAAGELVEAVSIVSRTSDGGIAFLQENPIADNIEYFKSVINRNTFVTPEARSRAMVAGNTIFSINVSDENSKKQLDALKSQYASFVIEEVEKEIEQDPKNSKTPFLLSSFLAQIGQFEQAEKYALMAIELSPTKQTIRIPLIRIYSTKGRNETEQAEKALALAKETYELDESKQQLWQEYINTASKFDKELFKELIDSTIEEGNEKWVEEMLKENIEKKPDSLQNRISLSAYYVQVENLASSSEVLDQAIINFPESAAQLQAVKEQIDRGENPMGVEY